MRLKPSQLQRYAEHFSLAGCIFLIGENCGALRRPWTLVFDDRTNLIDSFTCFLCQFSIFRVCRCSLVFIWRWNLLGAYCTWQMIHAVLVCCANFQFSVFVAVHWYSFGVGISLVPTVRDRWYMQYWYVVPIFNFPCLSLFTGIHLALESPWCLLYVTDDTCSTGMFICFA